MCEASRKEENERICKFWEAHVFWVVQFLRGCCLWPYTSAKVKLVGRIIFLSTLFNMLHAKVASIIMKRNTLAGADLAETLFHLVIIVGSFYVSIFLMIHEKKIEKIIRSLYTDYNNSKNENEKNVALKMIRNGYRSSVVVASLIYAVYFIVGIIMFKCQIKDGIAQYHLEFFVNDEKYFWVLSVYMLALILQIGLIAATLASAYIFFSIYLVHKFQNLRIKIEIIGRGSDHFKNDDSNNAWQSDRVKKKLIKNIISHVECIEFVKIFNDVAQPIFFTILSGLVFVISLAGFSMAVVFIENDLFNVLKLLITYIGALIILMTTCYPSDKLTEVSKNICMACYCSDWYQMKPKLRSLLILTMARTSRPCYITVCPGVPVDFNTFTVVFKTAMSYVAALISIQS